MGIMSDERKESGGKLKRRIRGRGGEI